MKVLKKIIGCIIIIGLCILVIHPAITAGVTLFVIIKAGEVVMYWILANLISKLIFGKSLRKWLFEDEEES
jgi:hypothetical protein